MGLDFDALVNGPCVDTFGVAATTGGLAIYTPAGGVAAPVDGIFDEAWTSVEVSTGRHSVPISTTKPRFGARQVLFLVQPLPGDRLTLANSRSFEVEDVQPDGFGWVYLILTEI